jgi:general stress protein 26
MAEQQTEASAKHPDPYKEANADENVSLEQKVRDLSAFMTHCKFGMMTTRDAGSGNLVSRCMALAAQVRIRPQPCEQQSDCPLTKQTPLQESGGIDLLFHTNTESGKTDDIASDSHVNISFLNYAGDWASVSATASVVTDRSLIQKHYSQDLKAWLGDLGDGVHDGGVNDPRIGIIRVKMTTAHYAVSSKSILGQMAQVAQGVVTGKPASVNKLREISAEEVIQWRSSH